MTEPDEVDLDAAAAQLRATSVVAAPAVLRAVYGVDPDDTGVLLDLAAMALTHHAWRNTAIEDAHSQGAIDDADQIVSNIDAWRIVRARTTHSSDWWTPDPPETARALATAQRPVAGRTLTSRLRGTGVRTADLRRDIGRRLWNRSALAHRLGGADAIALFALSGAVTCGHWFGTPGWPRRRLLYWDRLPAEAASTHPQIAAAAKRLLALPDGLDRLAAAPDLLDHPIRTDLISTGIGSLRLPEHDDAAADLGGIDHGSATYSAAAILAM